MDLQSAQKTTEANKKKSTKTKCTKNIAKPFGLIVA